MKKIMGKSNPKGHYTPAIISNGMVYISGQPSHDPKTGKVVHGGIKEEVKCSLMKIEEILKEVGLDRNSIVQCRLYITSNEYWTQANEAYADFFGEHRPVRVAVPIRDLNYGCHVEIEAMAEVE
ncbi:MAG: RidA family protein [Fusobacterium sp. JB021]|nr:RidA family protein [Fusobacterium sp. JB020]MDP0493987.1 RidA family protein [Fusobacterium sp. JB021]